MITCPKCKQQLPDWATECQFCKTHVGAVKRGPRSRELDAVDLRPATVLAPDAMETVSRIVLFTYLFVGMLVAIAGMATPNGRSLGGLVISLVGFVQIVFAAALLLNLGSVGKFASTYAFVTIVLCIAQSVAAFVTIPFVGAGTMFQVAANVLNVLVCGATIWVLGATDRGMG